MKWNSFQPNFFILFQTGVLEDAPATFLASLGGLDKTRRLQLQNQIVKEFPNVSVIDVTRTVKRVLNISDQMVLALRLMAYLSILAGLVVVFSIARHEVEGRLWELNLLKVLGARFQDIQKMIQIEFAIMGIFAGFFGVAVSLAISYGLAWWFFENLWKWTWQISLASVIGVTSLSIWSSLAGYSADSEKFSTFFVEVCLIFAALNLKYFEWCAGNQRLNSKLETVNCYSSNFMCSNITLLQNGLSRQETFWSIRKADSHT